MSMVFSEFSSEKSVQEANVQQRIASNPEISVFVSASAGSGKTKLLVDRLLRLMLPRVDKSGKLQPGTHPQKIQCLTYSKAAAAEMAIRLQKKLSEWVGYSDQQLDEALQDLEINPSDEMRKAARALFAQVLDLPGGMRIQTNHAFCQSILQRFPLEASIIPQFKIIEEGDNILAMKRAFDEKLGEAAPDDTELLSPLVTSSNFLEILQELQEHQKFLPPILQLIEQNKFAPYLQSILGLTHSGKKQYLLSVCHHWKNEQEVKQVIELVQTGKSTATLKGIAERLLEWLNLPVEERVKHWDFLEDSLLKKQKEKAKTLEDIRSFKNDNLEIVTCFEAQAEYVVEISQTFNRYAVYEYTLALLQVFMPIWQRYQEIKRTQGTLYYNDLIAYTLVLLENPGAAWVLYKLDGGIEHILLDEVQDNSAEQWNIAADLATEFFSGLGVHDTITHPRTVFAVGDYKQSIYSFQGAKPQEFSFWHKEFRKKVQEADQVWKDPQLTVSFRSSQIILNFVDRVFEVKRGLKGLSGDDVYEGAPAITHHSARSAIEGRVDVWPLVTISPPSDTDPMAVWDPLQTNQSYSSAELVLAEQLASWIKAQIGQVPPYGGAPIKAGDVLILIRKRSAFSKALIRYLKAKNIPLANLVKTQLLDQIAVQDLLALCEALLLPQDDLTLACVLKSPLGGVTEESLMALAGPRSRGQSLWGALYLRHKEKPEWKTAWKMLSHFFMRIDYITPYALLVEVLGDYHGRAKLLARLGEEAVEAIDELLSQALQYETIHTPSLQGFLYWLKQSERTIKNEAESTGNMVRIMTVHGAKGLQGRLVILPDTMNAASKSGGFQSDKVLIWKQDPQRDLMVPLYIPKRKFNIAESLDYKDKQKQVDEEESNRLLYVALTRASEWLLICGWGKKESNTSKKDDLEVPSPQNWYGYSVDAVKELGARSYPFSGGWEGDHLFIEQQSNNTATQVKSSVDITYRVTVLPRWMGKDKGWSAQYLPAESSLVTQFTPSRPEGIEFGDIPSVVSPLQTITRKDPFYRGRLVHELLQYLPDCSLQERSDIALKWLKQLDGQLSAKEIQKLVNQVMETIQHPELESLFDSESLVEQPLIGKVNGVVITGQIDRMRILSDHILLCDFKSGRKIPETAEGVPPIYLKQMAAYRALLKEIYPHHHIKPLIVWTDMITIMFLPDGLLDHHIPIRKEKSVLIQS